MFKITLFHRIVSVVLIVTLLQSCSYYKIRMAPQHEGSHEKTLKSKRLYYGNFYVVHVGDSAWQLKNVTVTSDSLTGEVTEMNSKVKYYMTSAYTGGKKRVPKKDLAYINQLHLFVDEMSNVDGHVSIPTADIERLDVMNMNVGLKVVTVTGVVLGAGVVGLGVLLLIACNCPHTYVYDGNQYQYNNTLFTGATSENLERDDYKIMPDYSPNSDEYKIIIRNEEKEHQFTNLLELVVVNHEKGTEISMDQSGTVFALKNAQTPISVRDNSQNDVLASVRYSDDNGHRFDNESADEMNALYATFDAPKNRDNAKIVLRTKNNQWGGLVYNEFSKLFGKYYDNWVKHNHKKSKEEVYENLKRIGIPLTVSVKQNGAWLEVEHLNLVGDVNYNSITVPLKSEWLTDETIEVRIESGFLFWDLDYIALDDTPSTELNVQRLSPTSALGSGYRDDTQALAQDDANYMQHLNPGDSTSVHFTNIAMVEGMERTIFLHSKGYYLPQKEFEGKLDHKALSEINVEGGLSIYSRHLYDVYFTNYSLNAE